jgi:DNA-directed RNA polymerase subunit N (RpoN/RPB10)
MDTILRCNSCGGIIIGEYTTVKTRMSQELYHTSGISCLDSDRVTTDDTLLRQEKRRKQRYAR